MGKVAPVSFSNRPSATSTGSSSRKEIFERVSRRCSVILVDGHLTRDSHSPTSWDEASQLFPSY